MRTRLRTIGLALSGGFALTAVAAHAGETVFAARLDQSLWRLEASPTQCVLSHEIPDYGQARFSRRPGLGIAFSIDLPPEATLAEAAVVRAIPSPWDHDGRAQDLSRYPIPLTGSILEFTDADAQQVYAALERGMFVEIAYRPGTDLRVVLSAVRFLEVSDTFRACAASVAKVAVAAANTQVGGTPPGKSGSSAKRRSMDNAESASASAIPIDRVIADATVKFDGPDDTFSETVLITLTGIAREYVLQKRHTGLRVVISGNTESDAVYQKRAADIKTYLVSQGLPAGRVEILQRGQLPKGKNVQPEAPLANSLQVHLTR